MGGYPLAVKGAHVGILEEIDECRLGRLLEDQNRGALEPQVLLDALSDLADQALEGKLAQEEVRRLLVLANLAEGHGAGAVAVDLLGAGGGGGRLANGLGGELLARGLATGGLAGGLLGAGHSSVDQVDQVKWFANLPHPFQPTKPVSRKLPRRGWLTVAWDEAEFEEMVGAGLYGPGAT